MAIVLGATTYVARDPNSPTCPKTAPEEEIDPMPDLQALADAFERVRVGLADLDQGWPEAADALADRLTAYLNSLEAMTRNRTAQVRPCPQHRGEPAHACGRCRSEAIGEPDEDPDPWDRPTRWRPRPGSRLADRDPG